MKQIELIGPVDKRVIAYPLFKICDVLGKVLVVTDDANFRRFSKDYVNEFTVGRSDFIIVNTITQGVLDNWNTKLNAYDYVIIISTNTLLENNDMILYCHSFSELICTSDVLDTLNEKEYKEIYISMKKSVNKNDISVVMNTSYIDYIWNCEENKYFQPCKNSELSKLITYFFSELLGVSKEEIPKLLVKEEKWGDK